MVMLAHFTLIRYTEQAIGTNSERSVPGPEDNGILTHRAGIQKQRAQGAAEAAHS